MRFSDDSTEFRVEAQSANPRFTPVWRAINTAGHIQPTLPELGNALASLRDDNSQRPRAVAGESV